LSLKNLQQSNKERLTIANCFCRQKRLYRSWYRALHESYGREWIVQHSLLK